MNEICKYFDSLQTAVNIITYQEIDDFSNVERGMGAAWDMLCSLDMTKLLSEQKDDSRIAMLVNLNRESCRNDDVKSFLEIRQEDLNNIITQIAEKHPKYKQFHNCCEHEPLTDIYELPGLFAEKKRELEIICGIALTNTADVPHDEVAELDLPAELDTERARKYFKRAIDAGFMCKTDSGYKWLYGGSNGQVRLGYFISKTYGSGRRVNKLERLFDVQKLSASITQAETYNGHRADVLEWRTEIDTMLSD